MFVISLAYSVTPPHYDMSLTYLTYIVITVVRELLTFYEFPGDDIIIVK